MTSAALIENSVSNADADGGEEAPYRFVHSHGFAELLESLGASLVVTTYQAGKPNRSAHNNP